MGHNEEAALTTATEALVSAVVEGSVEAATAALCQGASARVTISTSTDQPGCLLTLVAWRGHADLVPLLVGAGLSVEGEGQPTLTPLMVAAARGHPAVVRALLAAGADPQCTARDPHGGVALHYAARAGDRASVALLLPRTRSSTRTRTGRSAVHYAAMGDQPEVVRSLHQAGWDLAAVDHQGRSALHLAAQCGGVATLKLLVQSGLNAGLQDHSGLTPACLARASHQRAAARWLSRCSHADTAAAAATSAPTLPVEAEVSEAAVQPPPPPPPQASTPHLLTHTSQAVHHQAGVPVAARLTYSQQKKLYKQLLTVISAGDDVVQASELLRAGAPLQPVGGLTTHPLVLAVECGRPGLVKLFVAAGAPLTPTGPCCSLLGVARASACVTPTLFSYLVQVLVHSLQTEAAEAHQVLHEGIQSISAALQQGAPWHACWPAGQCEASLTRLMAEAARANCPVTAAFLRLAGAWPFLITAGSASVLHAAVTAQHWTLAQVLVTHLGAVPYLADKAGRCPTHLLPPSLFHLLHHRLYQLERRKLEEASLLASGVRERQQVVEVLALQQTLYQAEAVQLGGSHQHSTVSPALLLAPTLSLQLFIDLLLTLKSEKERHKVSGILALCPSLVHQQVGQHGTLALLLATRLGLQQLAHLLLQEAGVAADQVLDPVTGTTALHQAAAYGNSDCVALLLRAGADPLQQDKYGHTPAHLAAMAGHRSTCHLLLQHSMQHPECRAGTTATRVQDNFSKFLWRYDRHDCREHQPFSHENTDQDNSVLRMLETTHFEDLVAEAEEVTVKYEGEAEAIKTTILQEISVITAKAAELNPVYKGTLVLAGSSSDGTKQFFPDEYEICLILDHVGTVQVTVEENSAQHRYKGKYRTGVVTNDQYLQGNNLIYKLYEAVKKSLSMHTLQDHRLSLVPPGATMTQTGVALSLAWQGTQYPLLLVGVCLVPALTVEWHHEITRPTLTPHDTTTLTITNAVDGSWRCFFSLIETKVLSGLDREERQVYLVAKTLLANIQPEPWPLPPAFNTRWDFSHGRRPFLEDVCLKNVFLQWLEDKRRRKDVSGAGVREQVEQVFRAMCHPPKDTTPRLAPSLCHRYFGRDFVGPLRCAAAPVIAHYLSSHHSTKVSE